MSEIAIRRARIDDAPVVLRFLESVAVAGGSPVESVRMTVASLERYAFGEDPLLEILVAELDATPVGCVVFYRKYSTWVGAPGFYIEDIAVDERVRGKGVGRKLMAAVARLARDRDYAFIDLAVEFDNPARAFYERIGMDEHTGWVSYRMLDL